MILSDREIRAARSRGAVQINPWPAPAAWSSTAVDLTLNGPLSYWRVPGGKRSKVVILGFEFWKPNLTSISNFLTFE
jgi:hypothetical protein